MPTYANTLLIRDVAWSTAGFTSDVFNCALSLNGSAQLRCVKLLAGWSTADITFLDVDPAGVDPDSTWQITDNVTTGDTVIPSAVAGNTISTQPWLLDSATKIKLVSSVSQNEGTIVRLYLQPVYQGIA